MLGVWGMHFLPIIVIFDMYRPQFWPILYDNLIDLTAHMAYHQRNYTEEPLRNSQKVNSMFPCNVELHVPSSSYLKSFKRANEGSR